MIKTLICDDEPATREIIRLFLEEEHLPIEIAGFAENGLEAVELIRSLKPQLIFMDINMPGLNGFQVIEQEVRTSGAKCIILTAYASFQNAQQALRLGVSDILPKPLDFDQLRAAILRSIDWNFTSNETVNLMLEYIHTHYRENIELKDLAAITYSTECHLTRLFKKHMNTTVLAYIHQLRIEEACRLMAERPCEIQNISYSVGYSSLNNFYKYFKRYTGKTPAQYTESQK